MRQGAAHARAIGPTCGLEGPRARCRTHVRISGPTRMPSDLSARGGAQAARALAAVSHAIRLNELSTVSANVAIPTIWLRGAARCWGNCMRHSWDSSPGGNHALPPIAPPVAPPVAAPVAPPVAQPLARQWRASGLTRWIPSPQTTCPSPTETDQGTTHRHAMKQAPPTPIIPHQQAENSPHNQHVMSFNSDTELEQPTGHHKHTSGPR